MTQQSATAADNCCLKVDVRQASRQLTLSYTFTNGDGGRNAYVFNGLYKKIDINRVFQTDSDLVYVTLEADVVVVSKKLFPVPRDVRVEAPVVPCTSRVPPGEALGETLTMHLPLRCFTPYLSDRPRATDVHYLAFELGYFLAHPDGERLARTVKTRQGSAPLFVPFPEGSQSLLRVELKLATPVAVHPQD
jgi:hypothetical protein